MTTTMNIVNELGEKYSPCQPESVRLDINPDSDFVKKYGRKVKAAGGRYSTARGYSDVRFVNLPLTAGDLIDELLLTYPNSSISKGTTVVFDGTKLRLDCGIAVKRVNKGEGIAKAWSEYVASVQSKTIQQALAHYYEEKVRLDKQAKREAERDAEADVLAKDEALAVIVRALAAKGFQDFEIKGIIADAASQITTADHYAKKDGESR